MRRDLEIPAFIDPHGNVLRVLVSFALVNPLGRRIAGVDSEGSAVVDYRQILSGSEASTVELTPTEEIVPAGSRYRVDISSPQGRTRHYVVVESGDALLTWAELLNLGEAEALPTLQGPAGTDGTDGADGADGVDGTNGTDGVDGTDGRELEIRSFSGQLQARYVGDPSWSDVFDLATLKGDPVEVGVDSGYISYRTQGESTWIPIYPISLLQGPPGEQVEIGSNSTHILWRYAGSPNWTNLISFDLIRGADGTGVTILGSFPNEESLPASGDPGDAYLILGNLWTWVGEAWVNAGTIQWPAGKSVELSKIGTDLVWRSVGDDDWTVVTPLADIKGETGDTGATGPGPELQAADSEIQWRVAGDETWLTLLTFAEITPSLDFSAQNRMRIGGAGGASSEISASTAGIELLTATTAEDQRELLEVFTTRLPAFSLGTISGANTIFIDEGQYQTATAVGAVTLTFEQPEAGKVSGGVLEITNAAGGAITFAQAVAYPHGQPAWSSADGATNTIFWQTTASRILISGFASDAMIPGPKFSASGKFRAGGFGGNPVERDVGEFSLSWHSHSAASVGAEPAGSVSAHELGFDHELIGTALQSSQASADGLDLLGATLSEAQDLLGASTATQILSLAIHATNVANLFRVNRLYV